MIALYVVFSLVVVGVLVQQLAALRRRSIQPSVERYHHAMDVLGEMSGHVHVLDDRAPSENGAPPAGDERPTADTSSDQGSPAAPTVLRPRQSLTPTGSPASVRAPVGVAAAAPADRAMSSASEPPEPTRPANRRLRIYGIVLGATVVAGGTLLGVLLTSASPPRRPASVAGTKKIRSPRATAPARTVSQHEVLPKLVGLTDGKAEALLTKAGLRWRLVRIASPDPAAAGTVLAQAPVASAEVRRGAVITLSVGRPYPSATVPNISTPPESPALAQSILEQAGFAVKTDVVKAATMSELGQQGEVVSEDPPAGSVRPKHSVIVIDVVQGVATVTIPDSVVGETAAQAGATLARAQLVVGATMSASSSTVPLGKVTSTYPMPPGNAVPLGSTVNLVISSGAVQVVPNLEGDTVAEARRALRAAGLRLGHVDAGAGSNGLVVAQAARPGRMLPEGTPISVVVGVSSPVTSTPSTSTVGNSGT